MQCLHRGDRIITVDEHTVQQLPQRAHDRVARQFLLAHPNPVVAHQRTGNDRVNLVAVVEDKDGGPLGGQILFSDHIQVHAAGRQQQLREGGGKEIHVAAPATGQHTDPYRAGRDRDDGAQTGKCPQLPPDAHTAATVELQDRPAPSLGDRGHLSFRIGRSRIAHQIHQGDVLVTVGIEVTVFEIDVVLGRKALHRSGFARTPQNWLQHTPGEYPVLVGLELVGEHVVDPQKTCDWANLDGQRRRAEDHGVAAGHVSPDQFPHFRVDPGLDPLGE